MLNNYWTEYIKEIDALNPNSIVIGCNYHTKWQAYSSMRFVLKEIKGDKARLVTRNTGKDFWTNVADLIFIMTDYNKNKAAKLILKEKNIINER